MSKKELKWIDGFSSNEFRLDRFYVANYNMLPNRHNYDFDDRMVDFKAINVDKIKEVFPKAIVNINTTFCENKKEERDFTFFLSNEEKYQFMNLTIIDGTVIYIVKVDGVTILYNNEDYIELTKKIIDILPLKPCDAEEAEVRTVAYDQGYYTITSKINSTNIDLEKNYNDDFLPVYRDVENFLKERDSGLIILRGEKGTGKTSLIRHLLTNIPQKYIIVTNAMAERIADPEFMSFMMDHKDSIFILEDCERILMSREDTNNSFGGAITNILNMSDGLLSDVFNIKFICTFNADISKIDSALLRKGRCFANYEFKKLCAEKTKVLLNERNIVLDEYEPMTLAEIYNYEDTDCSNKSEKKIGF